jgi:hypothetical protein
MLNTRSATAPNDASAFSLDATPMPHGRDEDRAAKPTMLKAASPQLRRVAMLWNKDDRGMTQRYEQHVQWNTCNAGFSDRTISMSATVSPRARNKFPATTLSRSSKSS